MARKKKDIYTERVRLTRAAAIRAFCTECMNFQVALIKSCPDAPCPLWTFRNNKEEESKVPLRGPTK